MPRNRDKLCILGSVLSRPLRGGTGRGVSPCLAKPGGLHQVEMPRRMPGSSPELGTEESSNGNIDGFQGKKIWFCEGKSCLLSVIFTFFNSLLI